MESQAIVHGQIIRKYKIPLNQIENLNNEYDKSFSQLQSFGDSLAGNLRIEKDVINLIGNLPIIHTLYACMQDCYKQNLKLQNIELEKRKVKDYMITQAWINCMQQGEYQPPHSHNINENGAAVTDENGKLVLEPVLEDDGVTKQKLIWCETKWSHLGDDTQEWLPFKVTPYDTMVHGQKLWTDLNNGVHGAIDSSEVD